MLYISTVRLRDMNNMNYELEPILLDERYDLPIMECLMYQPNDEFFGLQPIKDSGKSGDRRIYQALKEIEKVKGIKL